jgi:cytochrome c5
MKFRLLIYLTLLIAAIAGFGTSYLFHSTAPADDIETSHIAHYPLTFVMQLKNDPNAGKKIYKEYCSACHANNPIIPLHAPRIGHPEDWVKFKNMNEDNLFKLAAIGYNAMPARGGCFECTDQQLKLAIKYLLNKSHAKWIRGAIK